MSRRDYEELSARLEKVEKSVKWLSRKVIALNAAVGIIIILLK